MTTRESRQIDLAREADFPLGRLRIRPALREVVTGDTAEMLEPRVMQVLVALARRKGEVVSRSDLVEECWAGRVVGEDAISRCIARLRRLGETQEGFSLETIARVGYRLTERAADPPAAVPVADSLRKLQQRPLWFLAVALLLIAVTAFALRQWYLTNSIRTEQAIVRDEAKAMEQIAAAIRNDRYGEAFALARPLMNDSRPDRSPALLDAWGKIVLPMRPFVPEAGATVQFKPYDDVDGEWLSAGVTPLSAFVDAPRGTLRIKVTKPGFRTAYFSVGNPGPSVENRTPNSVMESRGLAAAPLPLAPEDAVPPDMVVVPHTNNRVFLGGWITDRRGGEQEDIPAFAIGRDEVTNREFKDFVDAGGYGDPRYWADLGFDERGNRLAWSDARKRFVDSTGRAGPAGWRFGTYPEDQADYPVGGLSWYEAVAYARFRHALLPTVHHWLRAAFAPHDVQFNTAAAIATASRFSTSGPSPALEGVALGPWGTRDMAGNVREWVWNSANGQAMALGGAWPDYAMANAGAYTIAPMDRSPTHGLRLMRTLDGSTIPEKLLQPVRLSYEGSRGQREPASDDVFAAMRSQFATAHEPPARVTVTEVRSTPSWIAEEVVIELARNARATLFVVRPRKHGGALQPVIYSPPQNCCNVKRSNREVLEQLRFSQFIVDGGRALVLPIWDGSYERFSTSPVDAAAMSDAQRDQAIAWVRDLSNAIDYLAGRDDMDAKKVAYIGFSRGAIQTSIALAIEPRVKAAVFVSGGISVDAPHPMYDLVHYAPRIRMPVLMINGKFDHIVPYERSQRRLFDLLGTPADAKTHYVYDGGHFDYERNAVAREVSDWLDAHLGTTH